MYQLLALELDSIKPPGCTRTNGGWREEGLSRDHLSTDSIWSKLPPLYVPVSPSPLSREVSHDFVAFDIWSHTRHHVPKMVTYQVLSTYLKQIDGTMVYVLGLGWLAWLGLSYLFFEFGETKYYTPILLLSLNLPQQCPGYNLFRTKKLTQFVEYHQSHPINFPALIYNFDHS